MWTTLFRELSANPAFQRLCSSEESGEGANGKVGEAGPAGKHEPGRSLDIEGQEKPGCAKSAWDEKWTRHPSREKETTKGTSLFTPSKATCLACLRELSHDASE